MRLIATFVFILLIKSIEAPGICSGFPCCTKLVSNPSRDSKGKAYGFENGQSCIVPDAKVEENPTKTPSSSVPKVKNSATTPTPGPKLASSTSKLNNGEIPVPTKTFKDIVATESRATPPVSEVEPVSSTKPTPALNQVPLSFPGLPQVATTVSSQISPCESANAVLINDLQQCYKPLVNNVLTSRDDADKISIDVVDCICSTSHWRVGSKEIELSLKSSCPPPGNLTKSRSLEIHDGCSIYPYNYVAVVSAVGVQVRLSNGDFYILMSQFSGSTSIQYSLLFALSSLMLKEFII